MEARDEHVNQLDLQEGAAATVCVPAGLSERQRPCRDVLSGCALEEQQRRGLRLGRREVDVLEGHLPRAAAASGGGCAGVACAPREREDLDPLLVAACGDLAVDPVELEKCVVGHCVTPPCREGSG